MLKFVLAQMTLPTHSRVVSLIPSQLLQLKTLLGEGLINFRILFLKSTKLFEFQRVKSKLSHSMIVEGKKEILKKLCLILKQRMLSTFLVAYACVFFRYLSGKDIEDFCFCKFCKTFLVFCTNVVTEVILNLILGKVFP